MKELLKYIYSFFKEKFKINISYNKFIKILKILNLYQNIEEIVKIVKWWKELIVIVINKNKILEILEQIQTSDLFLIDDNFSYDWQQTIYIFFKYKDYKKHLKFIGNYINIDYNKKDKLFLIRIIKDIRFDVKDIYIDLKKTYKNKEIFFTNWYYDIFYNLNLKY